MKDYTLFRAIGRSSVSVCALVTAVSPAKRMNRSKYRLGGRLEWAKGTKCWPRDEYALTMHPWWRCGFMSNYFDHLFCTTIVGCR